MQPGNNSYIPQSAQVYVHNASDAFYYSLLLQFIVFWLMSALVLHSQSSILKRKGNREENVSSFAIITSPVLFW